MKCESRAGAQTALNEFEAKRRRALVEREKTFAEQARRLQSAGDSVSAKLSRVRVSVRAGADLRAFREFATRNLKGFRASSFAVLQAKQNLSFRGLAEACRAGEVQLKALAPFSPSDVNRFAGLSRAALRELEALPQVVATGIELNVALRGTPVWRRIEDLSRGQKATAILLLLLLPSEAPLVVDQPEDDLDNRFIADDVVPAIRQTKAERQYILTTHNANVPVLADAELIAGLTPVGDAGSAGTAEVLPENCGSIDKASVCDLVEQQLEGGHEAFEERRRRYAHGAPASSTSGTTS